MRLVRTTSLIAAATLVAVLTGATPAPAAFPNRCASYKEKCVSKKTTALLSCHYKAEIKGFLDPICLQRAKDKFDGGADPTRSCFAKLEAKYTCYTTGDTAALEAKVDAFVVDVVQELDPASPPPTINRCSAFKKKCVSKKAASLLTCYSKGAARGQIVEPVCITKAQTKFDGGAVPAKGCFAKLEAKYGAACLTTGDTAALEAKVDAFVLDVASELEPLCGNNSAEMPFEGCDGTDDAACPGLCRPPGDLNECQCPVCGDNDINQASEVCDRNDDAACDGHCATDCTCAVCGNNVTEPFVETCDGTDDVDCPGVCLPPTDPNECQCPICGDNSVNQGSEVCDGTDDTACPGLCATTCVCSVCGDNVTEGPEQCDGTDDTDCPGLCTASCTCP